MDHFVCQWQLCQIMITYQQIYQPLLKLLLLQLLKQLQVFVT